MALTRRRFLLAAGAAAVAPGCLGGSSTAPPPGTAAHPAPLSGPLHVLAPPGAVPPANTAAFTAAHPGVRVDVRPAAAADGLIAQLAAGPAPDAVLARQDDVAVLGGLGLLRVLDHDALPGLDLVDSRFLDLAFDRHNRWSAPAAFGVYGFGFRRGLIAGPPPADWAGFFAAVPRSSLQGIAFLPGPIQPVAAALAALDEDINTDDDSTLLRAQALLLAARPHVNALTADVVTPFSRGELVLSMGTSADFDRILEYPGRSSDTAFVLPQGRSEMWISSWVVPVGARHPDAALAWIDAQLRPQAAARAWTASHLPVPEQAARRALPAGIRHDPLADLDPAVVSRYQLSDVTPVGLQKRAEIWARVSAA
jgi:spermidine/putrescine transport system substrate-binding protein